MIVSRLMSGRSLVSSPSERADDGSRYRMPATRSIVASPRRERGGRGIRSRISISVSDTGSIANCNSLVYQGRLDRSHVGSAKHGLMKADAAYLRLIWTTIERHASATRPPPPGDIDGPLEAA